ncbi:uncharacterized protein LOC119092114 [Pollicipes pollicipes]|uniref:uncharacterized protein LOC119092114 n=1 Tax=Pollicipes pollicipes TaxID=41117 RepID=UPI001884959C|nr:uncharacterized protein LOC119092114 [Pollicipes pollicipes]
MRSALAVLLGLLSAAAADQVASSSYTAPEPEYQAPQQYDVPQYEAPAAAYAAPAQEYSAPAHFESSGYQHEASYSPYISPGGPLNLGTFKGDWIITGLLLAGVVVCLSLIGVITVPFLPFTTQVLPQLTNLFKARALADWSLTDVADTVNMVETAIERGRRFVNNWKPKVA